MTNRSGSRPGVARVGCLLVVPLLMVVAVLGLLCVVGAGSRAPSTGPTSSRAPVGLSTAEQAYLQAARLRGFVGSDQAVFDSARNACAELNSGGEVDRVGYYLARRGGLDGGDARVVLRAAAHAYCPGHESRISA